MKQKELEALKEYKHYFYSIKFDLAGIYLEYIQKETNKEQILKQIHKLWKKMNEINKELG